jgi:hypothetical protein
MSAKGEVKSNKGTGEGIQLYSGLGILEEIVAINPTNEQKAKLFGFELDDDKDEMEYCGKNDNDDDKLSLDIYYRIQGVEAPRKHRFFLENCPIEFEDEKDDNKKKFKWVNQVGQIATAEAKEDLANWFTEFQQWNKEEKKFEKIGEKKTFRKCLKGEDGLMRFLREALNINYELPSASLDYNYKKMFAGNVKELLTDLTSDLFRKFVIMTQVTSKDGEDGVNHYEKLWLPNNNFGVPTLPEETMKYINNGCKFPTGFLGKKWKKYVETHTDYPPAGYSPLQPVSEYDEANDPAGNKGAKIASKEPKKASVETDDDY